MPNIWNPILITEPTSDALHTVRVSYETMLVAILDAMLDRYEQDRDYPFIDTKLNLITGADFMPDADPTRDFKSKRVVYGWIQGRGLEGLAGHAEWLPTCSILTTAEQQTRVERLQSMIRDVLEAMETLRGQNHGRMPFMMTPDGQPLHIANHGTLEPLVLDSTERSFGDLFYAKGLYAAAHLLGLDAQKDAAEAYFKEVVDCIAAGTCVTDQQPFDPKNKVQPVAGRYRQGPTMISLFGIGLVVSVTGSAEWVERGCSFIRHILNHHVIQTRQVGLEPFDFVEAIDAAGQPWVDDDMILCDPGHALECVGAIARFLTVVQEQDARLVPSELLDECQNVLPNVLVHIFRLAWNPTAGGICKTYDLVGRQPHNDDMPWWSLPETIRAAALLLHLYPDMPNASVVRQVLVDCSNAFLSHYVNPAANLMAYQTRNAQGEPIDVIPATPDADPGYHTGLAIIDFLRYLD